MRGPYGPVRIPWDMKNIEDSRAGPVRGTAVSNRTGPIAWYNHENSADVKFPRALHSALRARNRTGDKNRTGSVVGCDWGIRRGYEVWGVKLYRAINMHMYGLQVNGEVFDHYHHYHHHRHKHHIHHMMISNHSLNWLIHCGTYILCRKIHNVVISSLSLAIKLQMCTA